MAEFTELLELIKQGETDALAQALAADQEAARLRDANGVSLLLHALYNRQGEALKLLREQRGGLDIFEASALGDTEQMQARLAEDSGAVNAHAGDGFTPLQLACYFRQPEATQLLIEHGADIAAVSKNHMALMAIHAAASSGDNESMRLLLEHGADANSTQHGGFTALMAAAANGNREMVGLLLEHGADAAQELDKGGTAADLAEQHGQGELAEELRG